ncbi:MAG: S8 family serine peptidase [Bacteroidota bacterium]
MKIYSLHIGVSYVDDKHYQHHVSTLPCCVIDAQMMYNLGELLQYDKKKLLLNESATVEEVKKTILEYSQDLSEGDLCIITYSGHGSHLPDKNGDEVLGEDQTWCLYNRQLIDDELPYLWKEFKEGVNIFVLLDSCHSGTAVKNKREREEANPAHSPNALSNTPKTLDSQESLDVYLKNNAQYDPLLEDFPLIDEALIKANVLSISACQDDELAIAGSFMSKFTFFVLRTLSDQANQLESFMDFHSILREKSASLLQLHPNLLFIGKDDDFFTSTRPFLRTGQAYPAEVNNLDAALRQISTRSVQKNLKEDGLLVDIEEEASPQMFLEKSTSSQEIEVNKLPLPSLFHIKRNGLSKSAISPWDQAHAYHDQLFFDGIQAYVEPALLSPPLERSTKEIEEINEDYLSRWPSPEGSENEFTWYLEDEFSQLASARDFVEQTVPQDELDIHIAHFDTGYVKGHPGLPGSITEESGVNLIPGEEGKPPYDIIRKKEDEKFAEQDYHGTATLSLLAGGNIPDSIAYGTGNRRMGGIPFATVHPVRISDTVVFFLGLNNTVPFTKAIRWAIDNNCEVITMSMGGAPIKAWAKAINEAYEHGITIVSAAGNSWVRGGRRLLPKKMIYPARLARVIGVTGSCFNKEPYIFKANTHTPTIKSPGGEYMEGSYPPRSARRTSIAAYTPNVPWAFFKEEQPVFLKNGGGTSSATPQVAAAAALWIVKNKQQLIDKGYHGTWKQVEAVKYALFQSADNSDILNQKYYGTGLLKARDALNIEVPDEDKIQKARKARISPFGLAEIAKTLIFRKSLSEDAPSSNPDPLKSEMILHEVLQLLEVDPQFVELYGDFDFFEEQLQFTEDQFLDLVRKVQKSPLASTTLQSLRL